MKRLDEKKLRCLDAVLQAEADGGRIPGSCILAGDLDGVLYRNSFGNVKEDSIFCLCSMTKAFTASAAMKLMEMGKIGRDDPVSKFLPSFANPKLYRGKELVPASREVTVADLVDMTSGILYPTQQGYDGDISEKVFDDLAAAMGKVKQRIDAGEDLSCAEACDMLGEVPLAFEPGDRWAYGMSADILAGVIEAAAGIPYRDFLKREFFEPLGMEDTDFIVPKEKYPRVADVMSQIPGENEITSGTAGFPADGRSLCSAPYVTAGGGGWIPLFGRGLYSTLYDYAKFCRMLLGEGTFNGRKLLSAYSVREMRTNRLTQRQSRTLWPQLLDGYGYGSLMRVMLRPEDSVSFGNIGEFGWDGLLGTYFFVDMKAGLYVVYMQQGPVDFGVRHKIRRLIYSAL